MMFISLFSIYFGVYFTILSSIVLVGFFIQRSKEEKQRGGLPKINLDDLIVIVPFRNEEKRIDVLLKSIKQLKSLPKQIIFIDDHSTDDGVSLIEKELRDIEDNYRIMSSLEGVEGKKMALRHAIENSESKYILTLDADVSFDPFYFDKITDLTEADMYILPAVMKADGIMDYFYEIDLVLVNGVNMGLSGLRRPIMASGANLLYRRETFNRVDDINSHVNSASGDDTYLLRDFRTHKCDVRLSSDINCAVFTETPRSFREFVDQRLRWIGKTGDLKDDLSAALAIAQSLLTLIFITSLIYFTFHQEWILLLYIYMTKTILDLILFFPFFNRIKRIATWCLIPIYEILYPFYVIILLVLMFTYKPRWKGREIYSPATNKK